MTPVAGLTEELAGRLTELAGTGIPPGAIRAGRRSLLNVLGTAVAGSRHEAVGILLDVSCRHGGAARAIVPGRPQRTDPLSAATATGLAAHVDDFDDTDLETVIHPAAATMAAALPLGELRGADGPRLLRAVTLGCEAQIRVGRAISPWHYEEGWHITGTCGVLGAAVAAGVVVGLDAAGLCSALAIAASQPVGHREVLGSYVKSFHPGRAAANGVLAALLAERGFTGPTDALEGEHGYLRALASHHEPDRVLDGLGTRWLVEDNAFKPYPCGIVAHPGIDAAVALSARVDAGRVETIELRCHPLVAELMGEPDPQHGLRARFSALHGVAAGLADGTAGLAQYDDARVRAEDLVRLRGVARLVVDDDCARDAATLRVRTTDGEELTEHVAHARGSLARPFTDEELQDKVRGLVEPVLPGGADGIVAAVAGLDAAEDLSALSGALVPVGLEA